MNYQNIPRKDKIIKRAFQPKLEALAFFDFGQIEARLAAYYMHFCGWDGLLNDILAGVDVHRRMAAVIYECEESEVTEEMRDRAKTTFFGMLYGAGAKRVREILNAPGPASMNASFPAAREVVDRFREAMPGLDILATTISSKIASKGYIETLWGRRLRPEPYGEHKMPNALIQGCAADLMKFALLKVSRYMDEHSNLESHMVSVIHDEIIMDCPLRELPFLYNAIPNLMDEPRISAVVPVVVEMEYSTTNWAEKMPYPPEAE